MKRKISIIMALAISLFIYLFYRSEKTVVNELLIFILPLDTYRELTNSIATSLPLNKLIIFSLPGGLWVYCATILSQDFFLTIRHYKIQLSLMPISFALGLELCQLIHITNGRFDISDVISYSIFWMIAYCSYQSKSTPQNILAPFTLHGFTCLTCFGSVYLAHVSY